MKLGVLTVLFGNKPLNETCAYLKNLGVETVEIGCGGFPGKAHCDPEKLLAEQQRTDSRVLDYSHTRAVLLTERAVQEPEQLDQVLESLILRPEFSWNLLIFTGGEEVLQKAEEKKEKLGLELAAYYRNHQEKQGISSPVTLLDLWNWRLGKEGGEL